MGEIGLDFHRSNEDRDAQLDAFIAQVGWAHDKHLPVSVHNRDADVDILQVLSHADVTTVLHCFSGSASFSQLALEAGFYLSFAGNLTFPRSTELRQIAAEVPLDRLLLETDSPALAPQSHRGRRNEPSYLAETAGVVAAVRGLSLEEVCAAAGANANRVFRWSTS